MSERKLDSPGILYNQYADEWLQIDENDIIDVSVFDFSDGERWLFAPNHCTLELTMQDLYTWLKSDPELELGMIDNSSKRCIDTRTFTRPKKRSSRMSFESIIEALSPSAINPRNVHSLELTLEEDGSKNQNASISDAEFIPSMLKPTTANFLSNEGIMASGQESMEAFLNASQSKGIDSFINLTEPELGDPLTNVSQPSILYSSIMSTYKDESLLSTTEDFTQEPDLSTCEITTSSKLSNTDINNTNTTHLTTNSANNTVMERTYCKDPSDRTFTNNPDEDSAPNMNTTFCAGNIVNSTDRCRKGMGDVTITNVSGNSNDSFTMGQNPDFDSPLNTENPTRQSPKANLTITKSSNATYNCEDNLNSTFKMPGTLSSSPKHDLNSTFRADAPPTSPQQGLLPNHNSGLFSKLKAPTSLRRELLAEVQRSGAQSLDTTYNHVEEHENKARRNLEEVIEAERKFRSIPEAPIGNKYNTFKKEKEPAKVPNQLGNYNSMNSGEKEAQDRKYYTFTRKTAIMGGKTDMENAAPLGNMDATFCKPTSKLKKKLYAPRAISRLPQFLQKSNPNLVSSSLKTATGSELSNIGYLKGSQPNILQGTEKTMPNNVYGLGKLKTGSIQRLLESNISTAEFQMAGAGSTESIESTQSAHSAPDLDDRLSVCSDSSHNSYSTRTMNIEQLHQIVRMQEESLKQASTPNPYRQILENNWVGSEKNMPSPIQKNGVDNSVKACAASNLSPDIVASSPIISPVGSSQSLNIESNENVMKSEAENVATKLQEVQLMKKGIDNKTRLRQPTNFKASNPGNRMGLPVASGIPRPPSRIPGPRFQRPNVKTAQGDSKRGYF